MKLGVDVYSLRSQGWDAFEHLEYAARLGLDVVHFSDPDPFEQLDDGYLKEVKARADDLGLDLEVGMGSICPTSTAFDGEPEEAVGRLRATMHIAAVLGSPVVRCLIGNLAERYTDLPLAAHIEATIDVCRAVRDEALDMGLMLAIENHAGDLQGRELRALIEAAGPDYVGACIDTGNAIWAMESPFTTLDHVAEYVVASHIRDSAVWRHPDGAMVQWVALGDGNVGLKAWAAAFAARCPDVAFTLETITGMPPRVMSYLAPDYWRGFPETPAAEFVAFLKLVEAGTPFTGPMLTVGRGQAQPDAYRAALAVQQRLDFERSVRYAQEELGLGER